MVLERIGGPLTLRDIARPEPGPSEVLLAVKACGVCRTDLHVLDGDLSDPKLPLVLGHEIVGTVAAVGAEVTGISVGARMGIPWLGRTCGHCLYCRADRENLCDTAGFTGYQLDGGFAEYAVADARYCFPIPVDYADAEAAPLLCAGLIGYRAFRMSGTGHRLGLYGFGAAAHILAQIALHEGREVFAFTRPGDERKQAFARQLGAIWAGGSDQAAPEELDAAILLAPVGNLVPAALRAIRRGGTVVCAGIHMSPIPSFSYDLLWGERTICSVANLTRQDGLEFFQLAPEVPVQTTITTFPLEEANDALERLRDGSLEGAAVLIVSN